MPMTGVLLWMQGLKVAPALITINPTQEAVNPVGPLKISDARVTETLPALPDWAQVTSPEWPGQPQFWTVLGFIGSSAAQVKSQSGSMANGKAP